MIALPLTLGQRCWFVPTSRWDGEARYVTVVRLGSKWAYLDQRDGLRVSIQTGELDRSELGNSLAGVLYASQEEHAQVTSVRAAWEHLAQHIRARGMFSRMPQGLTFERIEEARKLLGIEAPQ